MLIMLCADNVSIYHFEVYENIIDGRCVSRQWAMLSFKGKQLFKLVCCIGIVCMEQYSFMYKETVYIAYQ